MKVLTPVSYQDIATNQLAMPTYPVPWVWLKLGSCPTKGTQVSRKFFNSKHLHSHQVLQSPSRWQGERYLANAGRQPVAAGRPRILNWGGLWIRIW
jgi:hypothetical protein